MAEKRKNRAVQSTLVDGTHECITGWGSGQLFFCGQGDCRPLERGPGSVGGEIVYLIDLKPITALQSPKECRLKMPNRVEKANEPNGLTKDDHLVLYISPCGKVSITPSSCDREFGIG